MNSKSKAIVLDMDGTMLNHENVVSENLSAYIKKLRSQGKIVFIATGRTKREIERIIPPGLQVDGIVSANGMAVYMEEEQIAIHELEAELVTDLVGKAGQAGIYYEVHPAKEERLALKKDKKYFKEMISSPYPEAVKEDEWKEREAALEGGIDWKETIDPEGIVKIYFFSRDKNRMLDWKEEIDQVKRSTEFSAFSSSDHNVEVMGNSISKATGIQYLLDRFNLQNEQITMIGDSENDLPLMEIAGHAVAMQNAPDQVKEKVDEITRYGYKEDGLYRFLKEKYEGSV